MKTAFLVSEVDERFYVMEGRYGFKETTLIEGKAGEPIELPEELIDDRLKLNRQHKKVTHEELKTLGVKKEVKPEAEQPKEESDEFDPVKFLNENHPLTELVLEGLDDKELFAISSVLEIKVPYNIGKDKHILRILAKTTEE